MSNYDFLIVIIVFMVVIVILSGATLFTYNYHKKELEKLNRYSINVNADIDEEIPKILEIYVAHVFADYRAKYLDPVELGYITPDREKDIRNDVARLCGDRLSTAMVDKLSLFWNYQAIASVIADKVYLTVVAFCAENNATKANVDDIR